MAQRIATPMSEAEVAPNGASLADGPLPAASEGHEGAPPRLKGLELVGFKSFATCTVFQFERGITAIIGPNGSGKSNVSDAVRWALGEQSHNTLRSKKTEDVIFAGGKGRPPAGMAEVTLTFDNATGWLPVGFTEVTICRRAFRSGENQYLINNRRVRLKDVQQLTAALGQSYTVVGQGLVDAALSQRAEERRSLFEHAADLGGLRIKAAEAERNLAEAKENTTRIEDLLRELEPRLHHLRRAAKQAQEWTNLRDRLVALQRIHYARLLREAEGRLAGVAEAADGAGAEVERLTESAEALVTAAAHARIAHEAARAALDAHAATLTTAAEGIRRVSHERDLTAERLAALRRRREDMSETQSGLDDQVTTVTNELAAVVVALSAATTEVEKARAAFAAAQERADAARAAWKGLDRESARLVATIADRERQLADLHRRRALIDQRAQTDAAERARVQSALTDRAGRIERLAADLAELDAAAEARRARTAELDGLLQTLAAEAAAAETRLGERREAVGTIERARSGTATRFRELERIHASGAGLHAGVRAVVTAGERGELTGVRGLLLELIELPPDLDTAIEVALGGHVQDIVVERWADAERAIALLKRANAGRATFQPIDSVRYSPSRPGSLGAALALPGVQGIAAELLTVAPNLEKITGALLGRTLVVADLDVARAALPHLPPGWSAVTLGGEIVRTGGSVTGGGAVRESGVLGRERDLRELPAEIAALDGRLTEAQAALHEAEAALRGISEERRALEAERTALDASQRERVAQRERLVRWLAETEREQARATDHLTDSKDESAGRAAEGESLTADIERLSALLDEARRGREGLVRRLDGAAAAVAEAEADVHAAQRAVVGLEERQRSERRRESGLLAQRSALGEERALRVERAAAIDGEIDGLLQGLRRLEDELARMNAERAELEVGRGPLDAEVRRAASSVASEERRLEAARTALIEAERRRGMTGMEAERVRGEVATLRQRIADDLDLADPSNLLASSDEAPPEDMRDPVAVEREVGRLRDRLRRVGFVGDNAVEDYEREAERHRFLREQLDDVTGASGALHELLAELRATMRQRFDETLSKVAGAFSETFTTLFGGGTARLVLVTGEDGEAGVGGVDIVAQPPGKRLQSLALLSGGERALTGAALLIAMLKVNPTPFCLLDEVDAALDEANVVRFRDQLQALSRETQAIIITHNRGTIDVADTLYGVTMRDDGVSSVLSLRLADVEYGQG